MTDEELLQTYIDLVPFLAKMLGPSCEVALHSMVDPDHSLIAIENAVSGRKKGGPLTAFAKELAEKGTFLDGNYLVNYTGKTASKEFLSSTFFIKNEDRLVGMLCINKDLTIFKELDWTLANLQMQFNLKIPKNSEYSEHLDNPMDIYVRERISEEISKSGVTPTRLSAEEKIHIIRRLHERGITTMKGAVAEIAQQLSISVPTVYRYIKKADNIQNNE